MIGGCAFRLGYRPSLDGLRGLAVIAVLAHHALLPFSSGGFLGVAVFFTLSGFLITYLLCHELQTRGAVNLRRFYLRRVLRLLPAFLLLAGVLMTFAAFRMEAAQRVRVFYQVVAAMFYVTNWMIALEWWPKLALLAHTWSLSIEEQFYSLWPAILLFGARRWRDPKPLLAVIAAAFVASGVMRAFLWESHDSYVRAYYDSGTNADLLLSGCAIGVLVAFTRLPEAARESRSLCIASWTSALIIAFMCAFASVDAAYMYRGGFTLVAVASAVLILGLVVTPEGRLARIFALSPLVSIGRISYGLYLWHFPVYLITRVLLAGQPPPLVTVTEIAATFAFASASYLLLERHFLRLKLRFGE